MDILTMATNGLIFGFGAWSAFLIVMGLSAIIVYLVGGKVMDIVEKQHAND